MPKANVPPTRPQDSQFRWAPIAPAPIGEHVNENDGKDPDEHQDPIATFVKEEDQAPRDRRKEKARQFDRRLYEEQERAYNWATWRTTCFFQILNRAKDLNRRLQGTSKAFPVEHFRRSALPSCCILPIYDLWGYIVRVNSVFACNQTN